MRPVGTIVGGENLVKGIDLPRKDLLRNLVLRLYINTNITTLGAPVQYLHNPAKWLRRLELIADGKDTIKSINFRALILKNFFNWSKYPLRTVPTLATGDNKFYQTALMSCALPRAIREIDSLVNTGILSTFELKATFGAKADGFSTTPTTYTLANAELEVLINEAINLDQTPLNLSVYKEMTIEKEVTQTTPEFQILLPVGNIYRGFMIEAEVAGDPVDNVINNVQIRSGTSVFFKATWMALRETNAIQMNMETQSFVGYAYVDFCPEGRMVDALNASQLSMLEAVFDVTKQTGVNYIRVYPDEIIVPTLVRK